MAIIEIDSLDFEPVRVYSSLTDNQLRKNFEESGGLFIAESPKVIKSAIDAGYEPVSLLCEKKHIEGDAAEIISAFEKMPVYTGSRELLAQLTGYTLTRGVLCAMRRKPLPSLEEICSKATRLAVLENVCDTTNIGSIFRSAAGLGIDGVILTPGTCDPLNRRAVRVSMGTVFKIPWTFAANPPETLRSFGFVNVALALDKDSVEINDPALRKIEKLALYLGTEGDGLSPGIKAECEIKAIIPMHYGTDSLNVGAAAAIAFWQFRHK